MKFARNKQRDTVRATRAASVTSLPRPTIDFKPLGILLVACAIVCIPLTWIRFSFTVDWTNHAWLITYFGTYFKEHFWFPAFVNTKQVIGMPYPVFYGYFFYPLAGLLSILTGANVAIRLICAAMLVWQAVEVWAATRLITGKDWLATAVACLAITAIYPMTNLYNRAAVTEFVAAALVVIVMSRWVRYVLLGEERILPFAVAFALLLGTHPITAVAGAAAMFVIAALTRFPRPRAVLLPLAMALMTALPFLYAYARFGSKLDMSGVQGIYIDVNTIDRPSVRFSPIPYDIRLNWQPDGSMPTPHMDAQINEPLALLCIALFVFALRRPVQKRWLRIGAVGFATAVLITIASVLEKVMLALQPVVQFLQFAYRLITYTDLFLLFTAFALLIALRPVLAEIKRPLTAVLIVCLSWSAFSVGKKITDPKYAARRMPSLEDVLDMPEYFYGSAMYAVRKDLPPAPASAPVYAATLPVLTNESFGSVAAREVRAPEGSVLKTNVQTFPWNELLRNGEKAGPLAAGTFYALPASSSTDRLEYRSHPDIIWLVLRALSFLTLAMAVLSIATRRFASLRGR